VCSVHVQSATMVSYQLNLRSKDGFTLVEVVVVVAVVALLAAIMVPLIAKPIDDAKAARAANETQVIAAALGNFFKDVGHWPTMNAGGVYNSITTLRSMDRADDSGGGCTPEAQPGNTLTTNGWYSNTAFPTVDFLDYHLLTNTPKGTGSYPTTGDNAWRGPYMGVIFNDPWDTPYMVNIGATIPGSQAQKTMILSAGPNMVMDTPFNTSRDTEISGDDIGVVLTLN